MDDLGFFTGKGERLAATLVRGICDDVETGDVGRRAVLDRLAAALELVGQTDGGASDPGVLQTVMEKINLSLSREGMPPLGVEAVTKHVSDRRSGRAQARPANSTTLAGRVSIALQTVHLCMDDARALGLSSSLSEVPPWHADYEQEGDEELGIWIRAPMGNVVEAKWSVGCIVLGAEASQYLDVLMADADMGRRALGKLMPGLDHSRAAPLLSRLDIALHDACLALADAPVDGRLGLAISEAGPVATWDGYPVEMGIPLPRRHGSLKASRIPFQEAEFVDAPAFAP